MVRRRIVNTRIICRMPKIQMPEDFYDQTPDANVLATEAVMNTIRTADMVFDRIGRLLRPLNVSAAGGLVLGQLRDHGAMSPSELGDRLIVTRATVTGSSTRSSDAASSAGPRTRPTAGAWWSRSRPRGLRWSSQVRTIIHRRETAWMSVLVPRGAAGLCGAAAPDPGQPRLGVRRHCLTTD